jgi:6-phosphogluconolactonase
LAGVGDYGSCTQMVQGEKDPDSWVYLNPFSHLFSNQGQLEPQTCTTAKNKIQSMRTDLATVRALARVNLHHDRSRRVRLAAVSTLAAGFVVMAAPLHAQFVYVANTNSNNVWGYSLGADGALTPVSGSPFAAGKDPASVAVDPTAKFAYVVNEDIPGSVSAYSIGANGALTPVPGSPFAAGNEPESVAVDPRAKFVYVANEQDNTVSAYKIGANGALTAISGSPFAAGPGSDSVVIDPTGKFAYVANSFGNSVSAYSIDAKGALTPVTGSPFAAGSESVRVTVDPTGKFAYVANLGGNTVSAYSIGSNGALTPLTGSPFAAGGGTESVTVDPTGQFAYVGSEVDGVFAYSIGSNGALTPVTGSPFAGSFTISVAIDPTAKFAYATSFSGNTLLAYSIGSNGALTPITGSPFATGSGPFSVVVTPLVPFAASSATLTTTTGSPPTFDLNESFTLGANSNGIDPVTEKITLKIGTLSVTIPAGKFTQMPDGTFAFNGTIKGVSYNITIVPLGNNQFQLTAAGTGVDLSKLGKRVTTVLTIGIDTGTVKAHHS